MRIKINRLEEGHNSYPLVCRRPAETVSLQTETNGHNNITTRKIETNEHHNTIPRQTEPNGHNNTTPRQTETNRHNNTTP